jgi:hypothetical protein
VHFRIYFYTGHLPQMVTAEQPSLGPAAERPPYPHASPPPASGMGYWPARPLYLRIEFDQQCGLPPADVWQPQQIREAHAV